ncbi:MAG: response regulator, partial [Chloroflexota bacterium]
MLAEDDATMLTLLKTLLKMEGFETIPLDSDTDVAQAVLSERPDALLMDVNLLHQNGMEVLTELRALKDLELRIVMSSGLDFKEQCRKLGADAFLLKPYMPDDL